jgi:hypothetical protein
MCRPTAAKGSTQRLQKVQTNGAQLAKGSDQRLQTVQTNGCKAAQSFKAEATALEAVREHLQVATSQSCA